MNATKTARPGLAILTLGLALCAPQFGAHSGALWAQEAPAPMQNEAAGEVDAAGKRAIEGLVAALQQGDEAAREKAALPFLHRSLLTEDGKAVDPSVKKFAWKKAVANAPGLESPLRIVRVRSKGNPTIGEGSKSVERGRVDDYFLARRDKDALPARITLFFPQNGEPKVYDLSGI